MDGNHALSVSAKGGLTVTQTSGAGTKVGTSDPMVACGCAMAHRLKGTPGITGLSPQESISTGVFGTSMSALLILGLEQVPRVRLFAY